MEDGYHITGGEGMMVHASNESAVRAQLEFEVCEGIPTEALERLADAGGVQMLWSRIENFYDYPDWVDPPNNLRRLFEAIGPLEDENG